ncbi:MAG: Rho termination factor N-terminal domain-containing protein [Synechococcales bacterium]|nr:Rho termination factor N-terminal domain-containing protein [Synechococcales bacterium]
MQDFLTLTFEAVALLGMAHMILSFGVFLMARRRRISPGQLELFSIESFPDLDNLPPLPEIEAIAAEVLELCPSCGEAINPQDTGLDGRQCQGCWESECAAAWWEASPIDLDDLLAIPPTPAPVRLEWASIRQLKALASLYQVPRFNRLRKPELVEVLQEAIA